MQGAAERGYRIAVSVTEHRYPHILSARASNQLAGWKHLMRRKLCPGCTNECVLTYHWHGTAPVWPVVFGSESHLREVLNISFAREYGCFDVG